MTIRLNPADLTTTRADLGLTKGTSNGNVIAADATGLPAINASQVTALNATNLASGTVPTARLGTGTASSSTFLRGDGSWQAAGGGKVVGYQNTNVATRTVTTSTFPDDNTVPQSTEGAEYTTVAYTPTESGNKIVIHVIAQCAVSGNQIDMALALFKNSDASAIRSCFFENDPGSSNGPHMMSMMVEDTAADTSEITYKLRYGMVGNTSGSAYLGSGHHSVDRFGGSAGVQIHITEYDA